MKRGKKRVARGEVGRFESLDLLRRGNRSDP